LNAFIAYTLVMSTPKISFRVPPQGEAEGDVTVLEVASAPGKEREREPIYGGDIANISESMDVDNDGGESNHQGGSGKQALTCRTIKTGDTGRDASRAGAGRTFITLEPA
jgi:hypothetical protein